MTIINATKVRNELYKLINEVATEHKPIIIKGKKNNAVLISESDFELINETLYLLNISNMRDSIKKGLKTELSECSEELVW